MPLAIEPVRFRRSVDKTESRRSASCNCGQLVEDLGGTNLGSLQELQGLRHECAVILENAAVAGVLIEHKFSVRQAAR